MIHCDADVSLYHCYPPRSDHRSRYGISYISATLHSRTQQLQRRRHNQFEIAHWFF
jgi:hypothetical protein